MNIKAFISFLSLLCCLLSLSAQVSYDSAEVIDINGDRFSCFILNPGLHKNPEVFEYRLSKESPTQYGNAFNVSEFSINDGPRFKSFTVLIDRSPELLKSLSLEKDPMWSEERLFLKVLVEGKASLYYFEDGVNQRFFYSLNDSIPQQLICKQYYSDGTKKTTSKNTRYRQQLWAMNCAGNDRKVLEYIDYDARELVAYFVNYNKCENSPARNYFQNKTKPQFRISLSPGLVYSTFRLDPQRWPYGTAEFKNLVNPLFAIEAEYVLPFNKGKWSIFLNPAYHSYKSDANHYYNINSDLKMCEFSAGIRYFMFVNSQLSLFLDAGVVPYTYLLNSSYIKVDKIRFGLESRRNAAFGFGIAYRKLALEYKTSTPKLFIYNNIIYIVSEYQTNSLMLKWRLF